MTSAGHWRFFKIAGEFPKNHPGFTPANQPHQFPGSSNTGECFEENSSFGLHCAGRAQPGSLRNARTPY
jgi:hypothetical protein